MKIKLVLICLILQSMGSLLMAQNYQSVTNVFDEYQKKKGSVSVHLTSDILSQGSKLTLYKSLSINDIQAEERSKILETLLSDKNRWITQSEVFKDGEIYSATYQLSKTNSKSEFLLIKTRENKLTIIYLEGQFKPGNLDKELKKLKDLFIYINNEKTNLNILTL